MMLVDHMAGTPFSTKSAIGVTIVALAVFGIFGYRIWRMVREPKIAILSGAVLSADRDPRRQRPLAGVAILAESNTRKAEAVTDNSGYFRVRFPEPIDPGDPLTLRFRRLDFRSFRLQTQASDKLLVIRMEPDTPVANPEVVPERPPVLLSDVRIRYSTRNTATANIGSASRAFEIANMGNIPCGGKPPCSPDGKWKAAAGSVSLDTGDDRKTFRNTRLSCVSGPCPFTRVETDSFSRGGRVISATVHNWSDTVTYLLEAEVVQTISSDMIRHSYPVIFGEAMNFTLPADAEGPSIEADVDGTSVVFPLGPALILSWASCRLQTGTDRTRLYRCELKPGFRFR